LFDGTGFADETYDRAIVVRIRFYIEQGDARS